jgi:endo-1,4-beta-xylanase
MADDDTWLDSFPVSRTDYPLPFDMNLQAKPAYWGIVDKTKLPGYGLKFSAAVTAGQQGTAVITITATNGDVGPAYATQINNLTLNQDSGPRCTPVVTAPGAFPISLGDIPTSGTATVSFTVSVQGCNPHSEWEVRVPWSSSVYETGTFHFEAEFSRGKD